MQALHLDILAFGAPNEPEPSEWLPLLEAAIEGRRRVRLIYRDRSGHLSDRLVRPLGFLPEPGARRLVAWCESRGAFRVFRLDRIADLEVREDVFPDEPGRGFIDYLGWV